MLTKMEDERGGPNGGGLLVAVLVTAGSWWPMVQLGGWLGLRMREMEEGQESKGAKRERNAMYMKE